MARWTAREEERLWALVTDEGMSYERAGAVLGRTRAACQVRMSKVRQEKRRQRQRGHGAPAMAMAARALPRPPPPPPPPPPRVYAPPPSVVQYSIHSFLLQQQQRQLAAPQLPPGHQPASREGVTIFLETWLYVDVRDAQGLWKEAFIFDKTKHPPRIHVQYLDESLPSEWIDLSSSGDRVADLHEHSVTSFTHQYRLFSEAEASAADTSLAVVQQAYPGVMTRRPEELTAAGQKLVKATLASVVRDQRRSEADTKAVVRAHFSEFEEVGMDAPKLILELTDPVTAERIRVPARGNECKHLTVFDLEAHLEANMHALCFGEPKTAPCPICRKPAYTFELLVDGYLERLLEEAPPPVLDEDDEEDMFEQYTVELRSDGTHVYHKGELTMEEGWGAAQDSDAPPPPPPRAPVHGLPADVGQKRSLAPGPGIAPLKLKKTKTSPAVPPPPRPPLPPPPPRPAAALARAPKGILNVNTAPVSQLLLVPSIDPVTADRIISHREYFDEADLVANCPALLPHQLHNLRAAGMIFFAETID